MSTFEPLCTRLLGISFQKVVTNKQDCVNLIYHAETVNVCLKSPVIWYSRSYFFILVNVLGSCQCSLLREWSSSCPAFRRHLPCLEEMFRL